MRPSPAHHVLVLACGAAMLSACSGTQAGDAVVPTDSLDETETAYETELRSPIGLLEIEVSKSRATIEVDGQEHTAPEGTRYVGVEVFARVSDPDATADSAAELLLVDADETSPLEIPGRSATTTTWVAVDSPDDLALTLAVDGDTQRVDLASGERDPSAAAAYYAPAPDGAGLECPAREDEEARTGLDEGGLYFQASCSAAVAATPYTPSRGWAGTQMTWLTISLEITMGAPQPAPGADLLDVESRTVEVLLDGASATDSDLSTDVSVEGDTMSVTIDGPVPVEELPAEVSFTATAVTDEGAATFARTIEVPTTTSWTAYWG